MEYELRLHHPEPGRLEFLDLRIQTNREAIYVQVQQDGAVVYPRMVWIETADNGTLAIRCYPRDTDDPQTVLLHADGSWEMRDE